MYFSMIISALNNYSSLITAIATVALVFVTWLYIKALRDERKFGIRKEHTNRLKEEIIKPWLGNLNEFYDVSKEYTPNIRKGLMTSTYKGVNLTVENNILFNDLRNHVVDSVLFQTYEKFKENSTELSKKNVILEKEVATYLKDNLEILPWGEFYNSEKKLENGFFEKDSTLPFFLDLLLSGSKCIVKINEPLEEITKKSETIYGLYFYCQFKGGKYIDREITEEKKIEIKNTLERLLEEAKDKFKNDISAIHRLVEEINNDKRKVQGELERLKEKSVFSGECEFI